MSHGHGHPPKPNEIIKTLLARSIVADSNTQISTCCSVLHLCIALSSTGAPLRSVHADRRRARLPTHCRQATFRSSVCRRRLRKTQARDSGSPKPDPLAPHRRLPRAAQPQVPRLTLPSLSLNRSLVPLDHLPEDSSGLLRVWTFRTPIPCRTTACLPPSQSCAPRSPSATRA